MKKSECYLPLDTLKVAGVTHDQLQGQLASTRGNPFQEGHIDLFSCVAVNHRPRIKAADSPGHLIQISEIHGRAYELDYPVIWADEYGNLFTRLNTKGNNLTFPKVFMSESNPSGFLWYGLQDSDCLLRVLRASELLRKNHVDTEAIIKVIQPTDLPFKKDLFDQETFKAKLINQVWEENAPESSKHQKTTLNKVPRSKAVDLSKAADKMVFFITIRGLPVSERMADLWRLKNCSEEEYLKAIGRAFDFVNFEEQRKAAKNLTYIPEHFSIDRPEDIKRYLTEYLPRRIGRNLGRIHNLGLLHGYPHTGNVSTVGGFYDLDSMRGEALGMGDGKVTNEQISEELNNFLLGNSNFRTPQEIISAVVGDEDGRFTENFWKAYVAEREWDKDPVNFYVIDQIINHLKPEDPYLLREYFVDRIAGHLSLGIAGQDMAVFFFNDLPDLGRLSPKVDSEYVTTLFLNIFERAAERLVRAAYQTQYDQADEQQKLALDYFFVIFTTVRGIKLLRLFEEVAAQERQSSSEAPILKLKKDSKLVNYLTDFYLDFIKKAGWEKKAVKNADHLDNLLNDFTVPLAVREHVRELIAAELKLDFCFDLAKEQMVQNFHQQDQASALALVNQAKTTGQEVEVALKENSQGHNFITDHFSRYAEYVSRSIQEQLFKQFSGEINKLTRKWGEQKVDIIIGLLSGPTSYRFVDELTDDEVKEIEQQSQMRIGSLLR